MSSQAILPYGSQSQGGKKRKTARMLIKTSKMSFRRRPAKISSIGKVSWRPDLFPRVLVTKLYYSDVVLLTTLSGAANINCQFRLNSIYDTDFTNAGHQPKYFDILFNGPGTAMPYQHYCVLGCKVKITLLNTSTSAVVVTSCVDTYGQVPTSLNQALEHVDSDPGTSCKMLCAPMTAEIPKVCQTYVDMRRFWGLPVGTPDFGAAYSANPVIPIYTTIQAWAADGAATITSGLRCRVELEYLTRCDNRNLSSLN